MQGLNVCAVRKAGVGVGVAGRGGEGPVAARGVWVTAVHSV